MNCESCLHWVKRSYKLYTDGTTSKDVYQAPEGKGMCDILDVETDPDFGCKKFMEGGHDKALVQNGEPWQVWEYGPCPQCEGRGCMLVPMRPACRHCAGLGKVRYYDDGYIADASWDHPKEKELKRQQRKMDDIEALRQQAAALGVTLNIPTDPGLVLAPVKKAEEGVIEGNSL